MNQNKEVEILEVDNGRNQQGNFITLLIPIQSHTYTAVLKKCYVGVGFDNLCVVTSIVVTKIINTWSWVVIGKFAKNDALVFYNQVIKV